MGAVLAKLQTGKCVESPFPIKATEKVRVMIKGRLHAEGRSQAPAMHGHPLKSHMDFLLVGGLLESATDPDADVFRQVFAEGATWLGVDQPLPRTPAVYPEKTKWRVDHEEGMPAPMQKHNAMSTEGQEVWLQKHFDEQWRQGRVVWVAKEGEDLRQLGPGFVRAPEDTLSIAAMECKVKA